MLFFAFFLGAAFGMSLTIAGWSLYQLRERERAYSAQEARDRLREHMRR